MGKSLARPLPIGPSRNSSNVSACNFTNPYLIVGAIAVALHVAVTVWRLRNSYFFADDFLELELARATPLGPSYLLRDMFGHVEPLTLLTHWLFVRLAGWNHAAAETILVCELALVTAMIATIAARSRTPFAIAIASLLCAALSWTTFEPERWWCSGVQVLPSTLLAMVVLWICAKPSQRLTWLERITMGAVLVSACAFWNKAIFLILLCGATRFFVARSLIPREPAGLRQSIRNVVLDCFLAIVGVGLFVGVVFLVKLSAADAPRVVPSLAAAGFGVGVQFGWLAGVVGLRVDSGTSPLALGMSALFIDTIFVTVLFASVSRLRTAIWLWLGLLNYVLATNIMIAVVRTAGWGAWVMGIGRYHADEMFLTFAVITMVTGAVYVRRAPAELAPASVAKTRRSSWMIVGLGAIVGSCQLLGGLDYPRPPGVDPQQNRAFVLTVERGASRLAPGHSVGDRQLPERVAPHWMQPWNDLSKLATVLPVTLPTSSWDRAAYYMDDDGRFHAFADLRRETFKDIDNHDLVLVMIPPIENIGYLDGTLPDHAAGWFNPLLAPREKVRIAIIVHGHVIAWAARVDRPDVGTAFSRGEMTPSGFDAQLPHGVTHGEVQALVVIDNRLGVILPRISRLGV